MKNREFRLPAQWFYGKSLGIPENRNVPRKSGHLSTLCASDVKRMIGHIFIIGTVTGTSYWPRTFDPKYDNIGQSIDGTHPYRVANVFSWLENTFQNGIISLNTLKQHLTLNTSQAAAWLPFMLDRNQLRIFPAASFEVPCFLGRSLNFRGQWTKSEPLKKIMLLDFIEPISIPLFILWFVQSGAILKIFSVNFNR